MRRLLLIFIFVMLLHFGPIAAYDTGQNTYIIHVHEDGKATWIIEHRFKLESSEDEEYFQNYVQEFETQKNKYLKEFSDRMEPLVSKAGSET